MEEPHTGGVRLFVPPAATLESPGLVCQPGDTDAPVADAPLLRAVARAGYPSCWHRCRGVRRGRSHSAMRCGTGSR